MDIKTATELHQGGKITFALDDQSAAYFMKPHYDADTGLRVDDVKMTMPPLAELQDTRARTQADLDLLDYLITNYPK